MAGLAAAGLLVWFVASTVSYVVDKSYILSKATYTLENYVGYEAMDIIDMLEEEKIYFEDIYSIELLDLGRR